MSKADEMFKELEYKKVENNVGKPEENTWTTQDEPYIEYLAENETAIEKIKFDVGGKNVWLTAYRKDLSCQTSCPINMQELQAINKKVEELGWIK